VAEAQGEIGATRTLKLEFLKLQTEPGSDVGGVDVGGVDVGGVGVGSGDGKSFSSFARFGVPIPVTYGAQISQREGRK
jgi:hypothetical protein